jgi:hypothetical protein
MNRDISETIGRPLVKERQLFPGFFRNYSGFLDGAAAQRAAIFDHQKEGWPLYCKRNQLSKM